MPHSAIRSDTTAAATQDDLHVVAVLLEEAQPARPRPLLRERIRAVGAQPFRCRGCRQADVGVDPEGLRDVRQVIASTTRRRSAGCPSGRAACPPLSPISANPPGYAVVARARASNGASLAVAVAVPWPFDRSCRCPSCAAANGSGAAPSGASASSSRRATARSRRASSSTVGNCGIDVDQRLGQHRSGADAGEPLVVGGDDVPRGVLRAGRRQHPGEGDLVVVPPLAFAGVGGRELPVPLRDVDAA